VHGKPIEFPETVYHSDFPDTDEEEVILEFTRKQKREYRGVIGKERLVTKRKACTVGKTKQAKTKTRSTAKTKR
jgi:hypothetical protein